MIILACSSNAPYLPRIRPYLESICRCANAEVQPVLIGVECVPDAEYLAGLDRLAVATLPRALCRTPIPLDHLQSGDFLQVLEGEPGDVIIFTDGDIVMQRPFTATELRMLQGIPEGVIRAGFNAGPEDTLMDEAMRLGPTVQPAAIEDRLPRPIPTCFNTGVVIARRRTWQRIADAYVAAYPRWASVFSHYAHQQWILNYVYATTPGLRVVTLDPQIHTHGCYPLPAGARLDEQERLWADGALVVFKHHL